MDVIRKLWPEWDGPIGAPGKLIPEGMQYFEVENQKSKGIFGEGLKYRSAEESVTDYTVSMRLQMEKMGKPLPRELNSC